MTRLRLVAPAALVLALSPSACSDDGGEGNSATETGEPGDGDGDPGDGDGDPGDGDGDGDPGDGDPGDGDGDPGDGDGDPGDGDPGDGDGDPIELSLAADIQPIFDANCISGCHQPGGLSSFMDLTDAYNETVDVPAVQASDAVRVDPGASDQSYLMAKLRGTQAELGGLGARMPAGQPALDDATLALIAAWIDGGALP